jgi:hypothetical protein
MPRLTLGGLSVTGADISHCRVLSFETSPNSFFGCGKGLRQTIQMTRAAKPKLEEQFQKL